MEDNSETNNERRVWANTVGNNNNIQRMLLKRVYNNEFLMRELYPVRA